MENSITETLGHSGRMISGSKSGYRDSHPDNLTIFNSNICTSEEKIWYGDIDITKDREKLKELASKIGMTIHVLFEMDGRFENEGKPLVDKFVYKVSPDGEEEIGNTYKGRVDLVTMKCRH